MAFSLDRLYHPLTAQPFKCDKNYIEIAPCDALKPYIRCFWVQSLMRCLMLQSKAKAPL